MSHHLALISQALRIDAHAVLVVDGAGWHTAKDLVVPSNISLLQLPPYSPELNPIERLWLWIKERHFTNRIFSDLNAVIAAGVEAWQSLSDDTIRSVCRVSWLPR
jgi:transposase